MEAHDLVLAVGVTITVLVELALHAASWRARGTESGRPTRKATESSSLGRRFDEGIRRA